MRTSLTLLGALAATLLSLSATAAAPGDVLKAVELRTGDDQPAAIPDFGTKVTALFYTDADVPDMNDPLADALKAKNFDQKYYRGMGVANLQDSKAPNFIIRSVVRGKVEKYKSTILTDPNLALATAWNLGDCNNTSVVVIFGADKKVKFIQKGPVRGADVDNAVKLVESIIAEMKAAAEGTAAPAPAPTEAAPAAPATP